MTPPTPPDPLHGLSAREREVMDILHRLEAAGAEAVRGEMADPPSNATVRSLLRVLEEKGRVTHRRQGMRFVYRPVETGPAIRRRALEHVVRTFFGGSTRAAVSALVGTEGPMSADERARVEELLATLEEEGT